MNAETSFGRWVKQRRKGLDLTQKELAQRIGCSISAIQKIEIDERQPSRQIAELLAQQLAIAPAERVAFLQLARTGASTPQGVLTLDPPPRPLAHNLPSPLTPLIGREWEVATVCACLLRNDVRLLTITGAPGIGKTRLSLQVATELADRFGDGICFIALASLSEASFVPFAIARALEIKGAADEPLVERLKEVLRDRQLLLVLDNFEHVMAAAPLVGELLEAAPNLRVLITSRATLQIYGEHEFVTPPLALPDLKRLPPPQELMQYAAVALFVQRTRAARLDFALTEANAPAVAEICVRLDGLPLALELAAAHSKMFSPNALLAQLTDQLGLLTSGVRNLPVRQRTLRGAIAWSYDLLSPVEQRLFCWLGVFAGGCTLEAAQTIIGEQLSPRIDNESLHPDDWVLDTLTSLVNQSLVIQQQEMQGAPRFTLLEMLREFALEQLEQHGESEVARRAHATYFLHLAESFKSADGEGRTTELLSDMEGEIDNLRTALRWATAHDPELELRLTAALLNFWSTRRYLGEGREWLEQLLPRLKAAQPHLQPQHRAQYAEFHFMLALFSWQQADYALAKVRFEESVVLARELGDWQKVGSSLNFLALTFYNGGDVSAAYAPAAESVAILRAAGELWHLAIALITLGRITSAQGDYATAHTLHEEALALFRKLGDVWGDNFGLLRFSEVLFAQGDDAGARTCLEKVLPTFRAEDQTWFVAQTLLALGKVLWHQGDKAQARARWNESVVLAREVGAQDCLSGALLMLGLAAQANGDRSGAVALFRESLIRFQAMGNRVGLAYALSGLAGVTTQPERAAELLGTAAAVLETARLPMDQLEYAHYESIVAAVCTQLDAATFATAWAQGQAMMLEQAVADALAPA